MPGKELDFKVEPVGYDAFVILPLLKNSYLRVAKGLFDWRTWNLVTTLYSACPQEVQNRIDLDKIKMSNQAVSETKEEFIKKSVSDLLTEIKEGLENAGYLRPKKEWEVGSL